MVAEDLKSILEAVASKKMSVEEALKKIRLFALEVIDDVVRFDIGRYVRRDIPEIVLGEGKDVETLKKIIDRLLRNLGVVVVSRLTEQQTEMLKSIKDVDVEVSLNEVGRIAVVKLKSVSLPRYLCRVGIVTAGTADIKVAEEARTVVEIMGCEAITIYDVGIAGFHRVLEALKKLKEEDVDVVVAVAGMEGALPSVIASLIDVPVIGVPTPVGYGVGGGGVAALYSMLQACPLGLAVVNIDNGVGAGVIAALIGRRIALTREKCFNKDQKQS
jgi:NCAIR mutase (PurE)-related protein